MRGAEYGVFHFSIDKVGTLSAFLNEKLNLSLEKIEHLVWLGSIYINGSRYLGPIEGPVLAGDLLRVHTEPRRFQSVTSEEIKVIFENNDFIVVDKPAGIPVHATVDNNQDHLINLLGQSRGQTFKITHRLDIVTSGLVVLAKTDHFQSLFNKWLKGSLVQKKYNALVTSKKTEVSARQLVHFMKPSPFAPKILSNEKQPGWAQCILDILEVQNIKGNISKLIIELHTGRTHQIRSQLSYEGMPILGDHVYGSQIVSSRTKHEIALQSCYMKFPGGFEFSIGAGWAEKTCAQFIC